MTEISPMLVIGYGNDLRSDDGAGRIVAGAIEELDLPGVRVISVPQLTPEIALAIAGCDRVVFVDADVDAKEVTMVHAAAGPAGSRIMTHHGSPEGVLSLVETVGGSVPDAVTISIPASNLSLGFTLSDPTALGVEKAVEAISQLARERQASLAVPDAGATAAPFNGG